MVGHQALHDLHATPFRDAGSLTTQAQSLCLCLAPAARRPRAVRAASRSAPHTPRAPPPAARHLARVR
eukprot:scaffold84477_cov39-Phaeocystis_antarctica.AAC.1